jgi:hypothetical protein
MCELYRSKSRPELVLTAVWTVWCCRQNLTSPIDRPTIVSRHAVANAQFLAIRNQLAVNNVFHLARYGVQTISAARWRCLEKVKSPSDSSTPSLYGGSWIVFIYFFPFHRYASLVMQPLDLAGIQPFGRRFRQFRPLDSHNLPIFLTTCVSCQLRCNTSSIC